jgi:hypothetical protein
MADDDALFQKGMPIRREVLGLEYVDASMARADEFMMSPQRATTAWAWGPPRKPLWTRRPGGPIGCRSPRKRGPYSMPIHTGQEPVFLENQPAVAHV